MMQMFGRQGRLQYLHLTVAKHIENLRLVAQGGLKALLAYTFNNAFVTVLIIVAIVVLEK